MAKKSLFSILAASGNLAGGVVLDLYCGTGTLGLEALSCGAEYCYFADRDRHAINRLRRNIETCDAEQSASIWTGNIETRLAEWLAGLEQGQSVGLAFVDPPYPSARRWNWDKIIERIFQPLAGALASEGMVVLRLPEDIHTPQTLGPLKLIRTKQYGQMTIAFYNLA
jgi:16S rRNA (guanine(966)-N(2))-methyltransferase RsmD